MSKAGHSKLEICIDVLKELKNHGPSKITSIMYESNLNSKVLGEYLEFLIKQGTVEESTISGEIVVFAITQQGVKVLNYFR